MIKYLTCLICILLLFPVIGFSQTDPGYESAPGGLLYKIYRHGNKGAQIEYGDFLSFNDIIKTDADSVLISADVEHPTIVFIREPRNRNDFYWIVKMLNEGDSAVIKVNLDTIHKMYGRNLWNYNSKYMIHHVKVNKVIAQAGLTQSAFSDSVDAYTKKVKEVNIRAQPERIRKYIISTKKQFKQTEQGLYYSIIKLGKGPKIKVGDTVIINRTSKSLYGEILGTTERSKADKRELEYFPNKRYVPDHIIVDRKKTSEGTYEGLQFLNKGAKAILIVSPQVNPIQATSPMSAGLSIVEEIEVLDVIHPKQGD